MPDEWKNRADRAARYRKLAEEAQLSAQKSKLPEIEAGYLNLAQAWIKLADELDDRR